jgi:hypothetical protein
MAKSTALALRAEDELRADPYVVVSGFSFYAYAWLPVQPYL